MHHRNVQATAYSKDPRQALCETKYFGLRPQPLEQYLYRLRLSQVAERVFWLHWDAGYRNRDFVSEIALSEVARRVCCDLSSVTRAYQRLRELGLVRRQDPGRDPAMPFARAVAVTEILLPREAVAELLGAPDRKPSQEATKSPVTSTETLDGPETREDAAAARPVAAEHDVDPLAAWAQCLDGLKASITEQDRVQWLRPLQAHAEGRVLVLFAPNHFVMKWVSQHLARIQELVRTQAGVAEVQLRVGSRPTATAETALPARTVAVKPPRKLTTFSLAQLRKQLSQQSQLGSEIDRVFAEVVWSVEEGALARYEVRWAINIALKLVRTGTWTRPNRMPPNWRRAVA